jgi:predicted Mrr-cat superfamily restriction endonuclease
MNYWQISSGDGRVDLKDIFIKLRVALIGPGRYGDFFDHRDDYQKLNDGNLVQAFCEKVEVGDVLVLKRPVNPQKNEWHLQAVGRVVGAYRFEPIFEKVDIDDWDVQHCRRVEWLVPSEKTIIQGGGAPRRIQRLDENNPLKLKAEEILGAE